jgi:hypothetical protein
VLLDEVKALYAPQDHPVFELVSQIFYERVDDLYSVIGRPEITKETFWDIYLELLKKLQNGRDEELANILSSHQQSVQPDQGMPLLPNVEPFRLGRPLNVGKNVNYIGGLDVSSSSVSNSDPQPEYAFFTSSEEESESEVDT